MIKAIRASWKFNRIDNIGAAAIFFGIYFMGEIFFAVINIFKPFDGYASIGLILACAAAIFIPFVCGIAQYSAGLFLALKSGATRRSYMLGQTIIMAVQAAMFLIFMAICAGISEGLHRLFYSDIENVLHLLQVVPIWVYPACILVVTALALIFGTALAKCGKLASYIFIIIYFAGVFLSMRLPEVLKTGGNNFIDRGMVSIINWGAEVGIVPVAWMCVGILVALSAVAYAIMLKISVKD